MEGTQAASSQSMLFETPKRNPAAARLKHRDSSSSKFTPHMNTMSPSQRLKDLFFATYTSGVDPSSVQRRGGPKYGDFTSATLQTPTKMSSSAQKNSLADMGDDGGAMDVDTPVAQRTKAAATSQEAMESAPISESDLQGAAVPLAINNSGRFYSEHMRRCELRIELMGLSTLGHCPRGVYIMPSLQSINVWHGVMFVKRGYWRDAVIRFRIDIPREYPNRHPIISLVSPVFHPLVRREDGRFALEQQFPKWTPYSDYIFHALYYFKNAFKNRVLKQLEPRDCYNIDAYMKFKGDLPRFREFARIDSMNSHKPENLYKPPQNDCPIVFSPLSDEQYERTLQQMVAFSNAAVSSLQAD
ncbi:UBC-like protein [Martensiomyces pterosporus]|nr:UBC-like protein [Martensiomyces pterosporus]